MGLGFMGSQAEATLFWVAPVESKHTHVLIEAMSSLGSVMDPLGTKRTMIRRPLRELCPWDI